MKYIFVTSFIAVGLFLLAPPSIQAKPHSCDAMAKLICDLCGSSSEQCTDANETAKECKANAQYCPPATCQHAVDAFKRIPPAQRHSACVED